LKGFFRAIAQLYFRPRFFTVLLGLVLLFIVGYIYYPVYVLAQVAAVALLVATLADIAELYRSHVFARRNVADKLSNSDQNPIELFIENRFERKVDFEIIDEIPHQFQRRDVLFELSLAPRTEGRVLYELRPVERGVYHFGSIRVFILSKLGLCSRRQSFAAEQEVAVYPSYMQMHEYELLALSNRLSMPGIKKIRRIGQNREFEQINNYVKGDDYRRINWKATARKAELMVNHYQDERSQHVYCIIDKGRTMQMPFNGLTLLDYAINASLAISNLALKKYDKAGLLTFQHRPEQLLKASSRSKQLNLILERLYSQQTDFHDSDFGRLYIKIKNDIGQRSLLLLFTNFETVHGMERQLLYLRLLNRSHLLVVVLFKNTELENSHAEPATDIEALYRKGITEHLLYEKELIAQKLRANGIYSLLTAPEKLTANSINTYLELKQRGIS
jgi:uncharacterized protein (DUF58 family)